MKFNLIKLSKTNTAPFLIVSLLYVVLLGSPFIYFSILKGNPHSSVSAEIKSPALNAGNADEEGSEITDEDTDVSDEESTSQTPINITNWETNADSRGFIMLTRLAIFSSILAMGALGAAVSLITRTKNNALLTHDVTIFEIVSIQTVGAIFALILGFIFMGNLISGTLFPNPIIFYRIIYVPAAFAKLLVWSFIAGFSERLVPQLLNNLINKSKTDEINNES
ncbi:hypothetical protein H5J24_01480 [Chryseobacterium capnotolerans]|uniref:hypothetical protein n=1 Tax=Chryseobacterium TaxID=59732 RepID=UPI00114443A4|nr:MULTISPECIES: hypothetical protein [Chryseobacterium]UHO38884.1 hypothetical protein H5J24_01480 [Chryseobacterium capnotolerans]